MLPTVLSALVAASTALAQATSQQVAVAEAEYTASRYDAAYPDGFGVQLEGEGLLNVAYGGQALQLGSALTAAQTSNVPTITFVPESDAHLNTSAAYTVILADANPLGNAPAQAQGQYRHYLQNDATFNSTDNTTWTLNPQSGVLVTPYAGPGPAAGEGPHRYAWLLFEQGSDFQPQANLSTAGVGPGHWYVEEYVSGTHLGNLIGASFFTVENGQASYSVVSTSSVNTATVSAASATGSSSSSSSSAPHASSTGQSGSNSGASTLAVSSLAASALFFAALYVSI